MATLPVLAASGGNAGFFVVFGIFVVAIVVLAVIVIRWAVRHDISGRAAWRERQQARAQEGARLPRPPPGREGT